MIHFFRLNGLITWKTRAFFIIQTIIMIFIMELVFVELLDEYYAYFYVKDADLSNCYYVCDMIPEDEVSYAGTAMEKLDVIKSEDGVEDIMYTLSIPATVAMPGDNISEVEVLCCSEGAEERVSYYMDEGHWFEETNTAQVVLGRHWKEVCNVGDVITISMTPEMGENIEKVYEVVGFLKYTNILEFSESHDVDYKCLAGGGGNAVIINSMDAFRQEWAGIRISGAAINGFLIPNGDDCPILEQFKEKNFVEYVDDIEKNTREIYTWCVKQQIPYLATFLLIIFFGMLGTNYVCIPKYLNAMYVYYMSGLDCKRYRKLLLIQFAIDGVVVFIVDMLLINYAIPGFEYHTMQMTIACLAILLISIMVFTLQISKITKIHPMEVYRRYIAT